MLSGKHSLSQLVIGGSSGLQSDHDTEGGFYSPNPLFCTILMYPRVKKKEETLKKEKKIRYYKQCVLNKDIHSITQ